MMMLVIFYLSLFQQDEEMECKSISTQQLMITVTIIFITSHVTLYEGLP